MGWLFPRHLQALERRRKYIEDKIGEETGGHGFSRREASALRYVIAIVTVAFNTEKLAELEAEAYRQGLISRSNLSPVAAKLLKGGDAHAGHSGSDSDPSGVDG